MGTHKLAAVVAAAALSTGCMRAVSNIKTPTPENLAGDDAFRMMPVPSEDDSILGRILMTEPQGASSFEAEARPNPCEAALETASEYPLVQEIHRAQELGAGGEARAVLSGFGFSGSVSNDTHLVFDLTTSRKLVRRDTTEYLACCREHDCGFGYVSTLVYGEGEYASGRSTRVAAEADYIGLAGGGASVNVAATERKRVKGWVLAVVTPHEVLRNMSDTRSKAFIAGGAASFAAGLGGFAIMTTGLVRGPQLEKEYLREPDQREELPGRIESANAMAIAGGITGGVLTAVGISLLVVGSHGRQRKQLAFAPGVGGLVVRGRF